MRIACGWCGHPTLPGRCGYCGRDPELPYRQRGREAPVVSDHVEGRPPLSERDIRERYDAARRDLRSRGVEATVEALAEALDRSPRTVREWKSRFGL